MTQNTNYDWDVTTDVVIAGSGIGGTSAAITCDEEGLESIILEKGASIGGVSAVSGGLLWIADNHMGEEAGIDDSFDDGRKYVSSLASSPPDRELLDEWLHAAKEAAIFLEEKAGVDWDLVEGQPDYYYPVADGSKPSGRFLEVAPIKSEEIGEYADKLLYSTDYPVGITTNEMTEMGGFANFANWDFELLGERVAEDYLTAGTGLIAYLVRSISERGIDIRTETPVEEVISEDGAVLGVKASTGEEPLFIKAEEGVVLAIGGYDWNDEYIDHFEFVPPEEWRSGSPPTVEGDHLSFAKQLDAKIYSFTKQTSLPGFMPGIRVPGELMEGEPHHRLITATLGTPGCIIVNKEGKRFFNEAFYPDFISKSGIYDPLNGEYENWPCYAILDSTHRSKYPIGPIQPGDDLPGEMGAKATDIEDLAEALSIDPSGLRDTVETFNDYADGGYDPEFERGDTAWQNKFAGDPTHQPNPNLGALDEPPFYGFQLKAVGIDIMRTGLQVDVGANVVDNREEPIPNLYAAGNTVAYRETGGSYSGGFALSRGMAHGYLAAKSMGSK